jgi:hypothetical protein
MKKGPTSYLEQLLHLDKAVHLSYVRKELKNLNRRARFLLEDFKSTA